MESSTQVRSAGRRNGEGVAEHREKVALPSSADLHGLTLVDIDLIYF